MLITFNAVKPTIHNPLKQAGVLTNCTNLVPAPEFGLHAVVLAILRLQMSCVGASLSHEDWFLITAIFDDVETLTVYRHSQLYINIQHYKAWTVNMKTVENHATAAYVKVFLDAGHHTTHQRVRNSLEAQGNRRLFRNVTAWMQEVKMTKSEMRNLLTWKIPFTKAFNGSFTRAQL